MRRKFGLFLVCGAVLPLMFAPSALAQGAVMRVSPKVAKPGDAITAIGSGFNTTSPGVSPVSLRLSTRDGEILTQVSPDTRGGFNTLFPVPSLTPGSYLVVATQTYANGRQVAFTPARTRFRVQPASRAAAANPTGGGAPPLALTILGLLLLTAGSALVVRRLRALDRPTVPNLPTVADALRRAR